jgi:predicted metal-dependent enzyme (double-stranded beta helix superfamily)
MGGASDVLRRDLVEPAVKPEGLGRLTAFVIDFAALVSRTSDEAEILARGGALLGDLVAHDDWLPEPFARLDSGPYAQHLLHCDSQERFSVVSFVWAPGQGTPVHNHTVWGLVGVLRGGEISQAYRRAAEGLAPDGAPHRLSIGQVEAVSPRIGDIHQVTNALDDRASISIHVYGANIGGVERSTFDPLSGASKPFVSGYSNALIPNLWGEPAAPRRRY